jgi:OmpA-OmpF porin, OOP family
VVSSVGVRIMFRSHLFAGAIALATALFGISTSALSADMPVPEPVAENNWYISLHGGVKFGEDWDDKFDLCFIEHCEITLDATGETDNGFRVGGSLGYMINQIFAIEGEVSYMTQDFDEGQLNSITIHGYEYDCEHDCGFDLDGDVSILTGMVNLIAGFPVGERLRPYIGGGVGVAHVNFDDVADGFLDDSDNSFAAQAFVGLDLGLTEHLSLGVRGRILHIGDIELDDEYDCEHDIETDLIKSVEGVLTFTF